jgi:glycosyltransferase involved in cell wall biosynthesis
VKPKLVFISSVATPQQVKFCEALQDYFDAEFWFYEYPDRTRGPFWRVDLGQHCRVLSPVYFLKDLSLVGERYIAPQIQADLDRANPDILMLGGLSIPSNYLAYLWAKRHGKRTIAFTERSRNAKGQLRKRGPVWQLLRWLYRDVDMVMVSAEDAVEQYANEFGFGHKVVAGRYAADLDDYFSHQIRKAKPAYTYIFANRMTPIYNPLGAIHIFAEIASRHPGSRLVMNAAGELGKACRERIAQLELGDSVEFLSNLKSWSDLGAVYSRCDILLLPAYFSNGNFTILEAMASGMGLVISDKVLGVGKLVRDGLNGFNCPPDTKSFVAAIERYIADPELFSRHAEINRKIAEPFSARGTARFFHDLLVSRFSA